MVVVMLWLDYSLMVLDLLTLPMYDICSSTLSCLLDYIPTMMLLVALPLVYVFMFLLWEWLDSKINYCVLSLDNTSFSHLVRGESVMNYFTPYLAIIASLSANSWSSKALFLAAYSASICFTLSSTTFHPLSN
jgi:hypothetical protein